MATATEGEKRFAEARVKLIRTAGDFSDEHYADTNGVRKPRLVLNWKPELLNYNDESWNVAVRRGLGGRHGRAGGQARRMVEHPNGRDRRERDLRLVPRRTVPLRCTA